VAVFTRNITFLLAPFAMSCLTISATAQLLVSTKPVLDSRDVTAKLLKDYGRPEWIRTIDLFRVKEALWTN
jgi:hypothetical protein